MVSIKIQNVILAKPISREEWVHQNCCMRDKCKKKCVCWVSMFYHI